MARRRSKPLAAQSNERIKREYFSYLKDAKGRDGKSIAHVARALARFELHTGGEAFKDFMVGQAGSF